MTRTAFLLVATVFAADAFAEESALKWLDRMNRAFSELAYDGTFSYFGGSDLTSLRVVHKVVDGEQRERLVHLNGKPREIIRRGESVACVVMPGDELLELETSIPAGPFARAFVRGYENVDAHYRIGFAGNDRIAAREAARIDVMPVHQDRFGYRLWLDRQNHMLLRSELMDLNGRRLEIFQFSSIVFGDEVDDSALEQEVSGAMVSHLELGDAPTTLGGGDVAWRPEWLPEGFRMTAADLRRLPAKLKAVHTLVYTDGLAAFSVFIEAMPDAGAADMHMRVGATVSVNRTLEDGNGQPHLITLVGELPDATAQRIVENIRPAT